MLGISGHYRLGKNNDSYVVLLPKAYAVWIYVFCLLNIWFGCLASGLVLLRLPHPLSLFQLVVMLSQFLIYPLLVSVLVRGYWLKPIVFDRENGIMWQSGRAIKQMSAIKSLRIKEHRFLLIRFKCGEQWRIKHPEDRDGLLDMAHAIQAIAQVPLSMHQNRKPPPEGKMGWLLWI